MVGLTYMIVGIFSLGGDFLGSQIEGPVGWGFRDREMFYCCWERESVMLANSATGFATW